MVSLKIQSTLHHLLYPKGYFILHMAILQMIQNNIFHRITTSVVCMATQWKYIQVTAV